jgi:thiol-disulfide isomerase/thioredoxin
MRAGLIALGFAGALACAFLGGALVASAATAPRMRIASLAELPTPLPFPYDTAADGEKQLAAAKAQASAGRKLLLVDLGGNWCGDCRVLAALMERPELKAFIDAHYVLVSIDVGRYDHNMQIPARYGLPKLEGVPSLLIIDPRTGRMKNAGHVAALADARHMTPQALADWLASWTD